ncbi:tRNA dimethylallyltransferase, partial [Aphis craccivora]
MWEYLEYQINYEEMISRIIFATRKLAKHQLTWLKKWKNIHFLISSTPDIVFQEISEYEIYFFCIIKEFYKILKKYIYDIALKLINEA